MRSNKKLDSIEISYGKQKIKLKLPKNRYNYIKPKIISGLTKSKEILRNLNSSLNHPMDSEKLETLVSNKIVSYLLEDSTRAEPHREFLKASCHRLKDAQKVNFIIATGSHETNSEGNKRLVKMIKEEARSASINNYSITINDAFNQEDFVKVGETSFGTVVEVNKKALEGDFFYINADMKIHYFAGYSNALKDFLPGICSYKTIEMNHSMALDPKSTCGRHPFHYNKKRRDNPVSNDMLEATKLIQNYKKSRNTFVLSTINFDNKLVWSGAGSLEKVIQSGIKKLDKISSFKIKPSKYLIVSPGGFPQDQSLHSSQRGVDLSRGAIKDNGKILLIAECIEGITHNEKAKKYFYKRLSKNLDDILKDIKNKYVLYTHKAYKSAELLKKVNKIMLFTTLDEKSINSIHMHKIYNPQEIINEWIENSDDIINIIDSANKIAIYN